VDIEQPSIARVYDWYLGGSHNFAADRAFAERMLAALLETAWVVRENRAFLGRAVGFIAGEGVDQFIDIGSGIPTVGNVHDVAATVIEAPRVAYVDNDPVAIAHSQAILAGVPGTTIIGADMLDLESLLNRPELRAVIDFDRPVGVLLAAVLHFVLDDAVARELVRRLASTAAPGSYIAISHATDDRMVEEARKAESMYNKSVATLALRTHAQVSELFDGLTLVEPGVVQVPRWRPDLSAGADPDPAPYPGYAGIGRVG
jgi:hypothetical protein